MGNHVGVKYIIDKLRGLRTIGQEGTTWRASMTTQERASHETGVEGVTVLCDYWEFTVKDFDRGLEFLDAMPGGYEIRRNKDGKPVGWRGFSVSCLLAQGSGHAGYHPDHEDWGVHFSLDGQALGVLATLSETWRDLPGVMDRVHEELGGKTTRIDLAWDDTSGVLDLDVIGASLRGGHYTSRWEKWRHFEDGGRGSLGGETWYVGKPKRGSSDSQLVFYNKRVQQMEKGVVLPEELTHWVRCELRLRRKRANAAADLWREVKVRTGEVLSELAGVLRSLIEFKEPSASWDSNKSRRPIAGWWARFLNFAEKAKLEVVEAEARTYEDVMNWMYTQMGPSMAMLEEKLGFDKFWAFMHEVKEEGRGRMGPRHKAMLQAGGAT